MLSSTRRLVGLVLVLVGAVAAVWSAFLDWYGGRNGTDIRVQDLFDQMTQVNADSLGSLAIPLAISAVLVLAGILVWWRWLWALAGLVVLATVLLWGTRQAQTFEGLHSAAVGSGPLLAACAAALMLIASVVATARTKQTGPEPADRLSPEWTPARGTQVGHSEGGSEPRRP